MSKSLPFIIAMAFFANTALAESCPTPEGFLESEDLVTWSHKASKPVTLVNLWAVWCPPCLKELPMLDELAANPAYAIDTIHLGNNPDALKARFEELNITNLPDTIEPDFSLLHNWGFQGLPATMIVVDNKVKFGYPGYIRTNPEELDQWLSCLAKG